MDERTPKPQSSLVDVFQNKICKIVVQCYPNFAVQFKSQNLTTSILMLKVLSLKFYTLILTVPLDLNQACYLILEHQKRI